MMKTFWKINSISGFRNAEIFMSEFFNTISAACFFFKKNLKKWISEKWELSLAPLFKEDLEILTGAID